MGTQSQRGQIKEVLSWLVRWASTRYYGSALAVLVGPYKIFFPHRTVHYLYSFVPIAQQAGQAAVLGHLSLSVCLWRTLYGKQSP